MRTLSLALAGLAATAALTLTSSPAAAAADSDLQVLIDDTPLDAASGTDPITLDPDAPATVAVELTNRGSESLQVSTIRLHGSIAGLRLFAYETQLALVVEPGAHETRTFQLDLAALDGQAVGLLPAEVQLLDGDRNVVASEATVVDVRGSVASVYGLWGVLVAALAAFQLLQLWLALARHRLPANRWRRGVRFASLGATVGLLVVFALSTLRIAAPHGSIWLPVVGGLSIAMFLLGYLAPFDDTELYTDESALGLLTPNGHSIDGPYAASSIVPTPDSHATNEIRRAS